MQAARARRRRALPGLGSAGGGEQVASEERERAAGVGDRGIAAGDDVGDQAERPVRRGGVEQPDAEDLDAELREQPRVEDLVLRTLDVVLEQVDPIVAELRW